VNVAEVLAAKSEPGKDAGSARIVNTRATEGRGMATFCSRPEPGGHLLERH
jgi:hypothetical protein